MKKIVIENGKKVFNLNDENITALNSINLSIETGKFYAIMGHSGSGKTTLIQILGLLDELTSGNLYINGKEIKNLTENNKADIRKNELGFVFQSYYLNPKLKAFENVMLPMYINKSINPQKRKERAEILLKSLNLENRIKHYPKQMSGGEQQRVAIARALANNPNFILADEPTGNLDSDNEIKVFEILKKLSTEDKAIVVVSHNEIVKKYADEIYYMKDGLLRREI